MAEWRFWRGWSDAELRQRLVSATTLPRNFDESDDEMTIEKGWGRHFSEAVVARESPGPPDTDGGFERAWRAVADYLFSDPRLVRGHFNPSAPLRGRRMVLEARVWGLRYLGPVAVADVRDQRFERYSVRGFRYDTLAGHFERGAEWFVVSKDHASGDVFFRIQAAWRQGQLPNWWSRLGFRLLVTRYQRAWHRLAHLRLRALLGSAGLPPLPRGARLLLAGPALPTLDHILTTAAVVPSEIATEHESPARFRSRPGEFAGQKHNHGQPDSDPAYPRTYEENKALGKSRVRRR